ncbi:MAG TPA: hypothetical protein VK681_39045 [Reyranella sp.]|nr:hypothetical protein [Reyranella sp.]
MSALFHWFGLGTLYVACVFGFFALLSGIRTMNKYEPFPAFEHGALLCCFTWAFWCLCEARHSGLSLLVVSLISTGSLAGILAADRYAQRRHDREAAERDRKKPTTGTV